MNIWVFQTGEPLHCDDVQYRGMRAINLSDALVSQHHNVTLWSTAFFHQEKVHRSKKFTELTISPLLKICLIPSPGYKRNVSLGRFYDHFVLSFNLLTRLFAFKGEKPDLIFIGYPPIETASVLVFWASVFNIKTIVDVKDLWPQLFIDLTPRPLKPFAYIAFFPYFLLARYALTTCTALTSMSQAFLENSLHFAGRKRTIIDQVLPLVPRTLNCNPVLEDEDFEWWSAKGIDLSHNQRIIFVGSLTQAFDFTSLSSALRKLAFKHINVEFVICGTGSDSQAIRQLFCGIPLVRFVGWITPIRLKSLMSNSLASMAPYKNIPNFWNNFPNKIVDSLSNGLPVITSLSGEVEKYITTNSCGIYCNPTLDGWLSAIESVINLEYQQYLSSNALASYQRDFTYDAVYTKFASTLNIYF